MIQKGLWCDGYNPEVSSWEEIKHAAQVIELSEEVSDRHECRITFDANGNNFISSFSRNKRNGRNSCQNNNNGNAKHSQNNHQHEE